MSSQLAPGAGPHLLLALTYVILQAHSLIFILFSIQLGKYIFSPTKVSAHTYPAHHG